MVPRVSNVLMHKHRPHLETSNPHRSKHLVRTFFLCMLGPAGWVFFRVAKYSAHGSETLQKFFEGMTLPFLAASPILSLIAAFGMYLSSKRKDNGLGIMFFFALLLNLLLGCLWVLPLLLKAPGE